MPTSLKSRLSSGVFTPTTIIPSQKILTGATGTIFTITPPAGKRAALLILGCALTAQGNNGITVAVNGDTVVTGRLLNVVDVPNGDNTFAIGPNGNVREIVGKVDQPITITTAAATTQEIAISYAYGD